MDIDQVTEILARIDNDTIPLELQFFNGGVNQTFENYAKTFGLSPSNLEFLEFLQSDEWKEILLTNKLQIHIETGNIYYDNQDTNESIYDFFSKHQNTDKGFIDYDFNFADSYVSYFDWLIVSFDSWQKLVVLTNKNSKYLFYRFNDLLQVQLKETKKNMAWHWNRQLYDT